MIYTASKGRKTICKARKRCKQLSKFENGQIVAWAKEDVACREIARRLKRNESSLRVFLKKYRASESDERAKGSGRPRKTTKGDDRYSYGQKNPAGPKNQVFSNETHLCCINTNFL